MNVSITGTYILLPSFVIHLTWIIAAALLGRSFSHSANNHYLLNTLLVSPNKFKYVLEMEIIPITAGSWSEKKRHDSQPLSRNGAPISSNDYWFRMIDSVSVHHHWASVSPYNWHLDLNIQCYLKWQIFLYCLFRVNQVNLIDYKMSYDNLFGQQMIQTIVKIQLSSFKSISVIREIIQHFNLQLPYINLPANLVPYHPSR